MNAWECFIPKTKAQVSLSLHRTNALSIQQYNRLEHKQSTNDSDFNETNDFAATPFAADFASLQASSLIHLRHSKLYSPPEKS